jgi:hypothetical protein
LEPELRTDGTVRSNRLLVEFVEGEVGYLAGNKRDLYESHDGQLIGLLDTIIQNRDRHDGNWMVENGRPVPIDHGLPDGHMHAEHFEPGEWEHFMDNPEDWLESHHFWYAPVSPFAKYARLYRTESPGYIAQWLPNRYTKRDIQKLRAVVESLEELFRKFHPSAIDEVYAGRPRDKIGSGRTEGASRSYEAALDRLQMLEDHAKGTVDVLP